jgi:hypothetical protein
MHANKHALTLQYESASLYINVDFIMSVYADIAAGSSSSIFDGE